MKAKLKSIGTIISLGLALAGVAFADFNPEKWQYYKDITVTDGRVSSDKLAEVALDQDIFNNAQSDLRDLRLIADNGQEVPYKLVIEKNTFSEENIYPARILNNSFLEGEYNLFIVDLGQAGSLNSSLNIITSSANFQRQVEISGSNDMAQWNVLKTDGYIYDYTDMRANFKAQDTSLDYPENAYRYLEVKIYTGGEAPLAINGVRVSKVTSLVSREASFNPKYEVKENPAKRLTEVIIDLEKKGWPTTSMSLDVNGGNFNREVVVYESDDRNTWRVLGQSYIFRIDTLKFRGSNSDISYSESSKRYLKVEIYNGDNQPVSIGGVSVKTILRNIVFQYTPPRSYKLYYGNDDARYPEYDLERFFPYLDTGSYTEAISGSEQANPEFKAEVPPIPPLSERVPYLLKGVIALTILVLGFFIFRFMKKVSPR